VRKLIKKRELQFEMLMIDDEEEKKFYIDVIDE
jgi:hypothetical protein